jgi:hypothetical protein
MLVVVVKPAVMLYSPSLVVQGSPHSSFFSSYISFAAASFLFSLLYAAAVRSEELKEYKKDLAEGLTIDYPKSTLSLYVIKWIFSLIRPIYPESIAWIITYSILPVIILIAALIYPELYLHSFPFFISYYLFCSLIYYLIFLVLLNITLVTKELEKSESEAKKQLMLEITKELGNRYTVLRIEKALEHKHGEYSRFDINLGIEFFIIGSPSQYQSFEGVIDDDEGVFLDTKEGILHELGYAGKYVPRENTFYIFSADFLKD